jgi:uncharacterized damage-inducible protein DinB
LGGTETWIVRMSGLDGHPFAHFEGPDDWSMEELRRYDRYIDDLVERYFARLTEAELDRTFVVPKMPPWWDEDFTAEVRGTLLHVIEHELQHRGELNALLWQIDVDPPVVDWGDWDKPSSKPTAPSG